MKITQRINLLVLNQCFLIWSTLANFVEIANPDTIDVVKAADNYACSNLTCHKVVKYKVKVPQNYDCQNDCLPIKYSVEGPNSDTIETYGYIRTYIPNGVDGSISQKQISSKCRHIRRYFYNFK